MEQSSPLSENNDFPQTRSQMWRLSNADVEGDVLFVEPFPSLPSYETLVGHVLEPL